MLLCLGVSVWYFRFKADINLPNLDKINTILTDGNKAVSEGDSDNWVTFTKDANELGQGKLSIDKIPTFSVGLDKNFDYKKFDNINLMNESENITKKLQEAKIDTVKLPIELNNFYNNSKNIPSRVEEEVEKFYSEGFNVVGRLDLTSRQGINSEHFITAGVDLKEIAHVKPFPIDLINRENDQFGESVEVQNDTAKLKLIDSDHPLISKNISDEDYLYFFDANTPLENTEEIIPLGYHCDKMFNLKNVADPKTLKLWVSTTGKDEDYVEQNEGSEGYIFYGPKELQVKKYCHGKIKIQYSGADPQRSYLNKIDYDINPITGDIQTKNNNINSGYVEKEDFNSGQMSGNLHWLNEGEHQIVDGKLNIKSSNANGLGAMLYQEISGTGNFKVAFKIDPKEGEPNVGRGVADTGVAVLQDDLNWIKWDGSSLYQMINGSLKYTHVGGAASSEDEKYTWLILEKQEDHFIFYSSNDLLGNKTREFEMVSVGPENSVLYNGFYPLSLDSYYTPLENNQSLAFSNENPLKIGVYTNSTSKYAPIDEMRFFPGRNMGENLRALYVRAYPEALDEFVEKNVEKFSDRIMYWELPSFTTRIAHSWDKEGLYLAELAVRSHLINLIKGSNPDAKIFTEERPKSFYEFSKMNESHGFIEEDFDSMGNVFYYHSYDDGLESKCSYCEISLRDKSIKSIDMLRQNYPDGPIFMNYADHYLTSYGIRNYHIDDFTKMNLGLRRYGVFGYFISSLKSNSNSLGLFDSTENPTPLYWANKNLASNKGIFLDLADSSNTYPYSQADDSSKIIKNLGSARIGVKNAADISSIKILSSLSNTDDSYRPNVVAAYKMNKNLTYTDHYQYLLESSDLKININTASPNYVSEDIRIIKTAENTYSVSGGISGDLGTTNSGEYSTPNGVYSFSIPPNDGQNIGSGYYADIIKGNGFNEIAHWDNPGQTGSQNIIIDLTGAKSRYLQIQFNKASGAESFSLDEIEILDSDGNNISKDKNYSAEGADNFESKFASDTTPPNIEIVDPEENGVVSYSDYEYKIKYKVDGVEKIRTVKLQSGNNVVNLKARDKAGNTAEKQLTFKASNVPPIAIKVLSPLNDSTVTRSKIPVTYLADGVRKTIEKDLALGENNIDITEHNQDGLTSTKTIKVTYQVPEKSPEISNISPSQIQKILIYGSAGSTDVNISYSVDGFTRYLETKNFHVGNNEVQVSETNEEGTTELTLSYTVVLVSPPLISINSPANGASTKESSINVAYTVNGQSKMRTFDLAVGNNTLTVEGANPNDPSITASASVNVIRDATIAPPQQSFSSGWNMVTFPAISESSFGTILPGTFKVRKFNASANKYEKNEEVEVRPVPGMGYWMKIDDIAKIDSVKYKSGDAVSTTVPVSKGWNLLGNPFLSDLPIANLNIRYKDGSVKSFGDAVKNKDIAGYAWSWEGTANPKQYYFISNDPNKYRTSAHKQAHISPYRGFWVVIKKDTVSEIIINK